MQRETSGTLGGLVWDDQSGLISAFYSFFFFLDKIVIKTVLNSQGGCKYESSKSTKSVHTCPIARTQAQVVGSIFLVLRIESGGQ